ncbi:uncharacterized iron-regulated membrane protein [Vibrio maritimus]|uniref:Uncharacterized iron-regulated membrane protein n=1 Tax=Vibrio maritimus TaxID=990268 RepID=A0A090S4L9_9VIBR|nr:uncharacterized iron-regulated membrane protein [Vibrio maritimus]
MLSKQRGSQRTKTSRAKSIYFMTWRWHFYSGLFVIPFMLMLSLTGLIMLFDDEIEFARYQSILKVEQGEHTAPISSQIDAINEVYPNSQVSQFIPSPNLERANRFLFKLPMGMPSLHWLTPIPQKFKGRLIEVIASMS